MTRRTLSSTSALAEPRTFEDQIRRRVYELYDDRGREDGHELEDWLRAETGDASPERSRENDSALCNAASPASAPECHRCL